MTESRRTFRRSGGAGFTLLELILVMLILTMVVAIAAPSLRNFTIGRNNDNAATLIVSLADYARTQAASEGRVYRLNVDPDNRKLWLTAANGSSYETPNNDYGQKFELVEGTKVRTDIKQRQDGTYVEFNPGGRAEAAKIWLVDKTGGEMEIACESPTDAFKVVPTEEMTR